MGAGGRAPEWAGSVDWADVGEQLVAYAVWLLRNRRILCEQWDDIGLGQSAEDLAGEVMTDVLSGKCDYDPRKGGLLRYLKRRLRWKLGNLDCSAARRNEKSLPVVAMGIASRDSEPRLQARNVLQRLRRRLSRHCRERKRKVDLVEFLDELCRQSELDVAALAGRFDLEEGQVYYQLRVVRRLAVEVYQEGKNGQGRRK